MTKSKNPAPDLTPGERIRAAGLDWERKQAEKDRKAAAKAAATMAPDEEPEELAPLADDDLVDLADLVKTVLQAHLRAETALLDPKIEGKDWERYQTVGPADPDAPTGLLTESVLLRYGLARMGADNVRGQLKDPRTIAGTAHPRYRFVEVTPNWTDWQKQHDRRWTRGGVVLPDHNDFSRFQTLSALLRAAEIIKAEFQRLPAKLRTAAGNRPERFEELLATEAGLEHLKRNGLLEALRGFDGSVDPVTYVVPVHDDLDDMGSE